MKRKKDLTLIPKKRLGDFFMLVALLILFSSILYYIKPSGYGATSFTILNIDDESDFNKGTFTSTIWNNDHVELSNSLTGTYESEIFDSLENTTWDNITLDFSEPETNILFVVDNKASFWKSTDNGITWALVTGSYNGDDEIDKEDIIKILTDDNKYLYIPKGKKHVWKSTDLGIIWNKFKKEELGLINYIENPIQVDETFFNQNNREVKAATSILFKTDFKFQVRTSDDNSNWNNYIGSNGVDSYYTNSFETLNLNSRYFQYKIYFTSEINSLTPKLKSVSISYTSNILPPTINLVNPNTINIDSIVNLAYTVSDVYNIKDCSLLINNVVNQTKSNIIKDIEENFIVNLNAGAYNYSISCTNIHDKINTNSGKITVILADKFTGDTTNLTSLNNLNNIENLKLETPEYGKIEFYENIDLSNGADLNSNINITEGKIDLNSNILTNLNKSAIVTLYNVQSSSFNILRDNAVCPPDLCNLISYDNNTLKFNVTHFTTYSIQYPTESSGSESSTSSGDSSSGGSSKKTTIIGEEPEKLKEAPSDKPVIQDNKTSEEAVEEIVSNHHNGINEPVPEKFKSLPMLSLTFLAVLVLMVFYLIKHRKEPPKTNLQ